MRMKLKDLLKRVTARPFTVEIREPDLRGRVYGIVAREAPTAHVGTVHDKHDAAYLVHAANAFPTLLEQCEQAFRQLACREGKLSENEKLAMRTLKEAIEQASITNTSPR